MRRAGLANLSQPAMAALLQSVVGKWGAMLVNAGLIISVVGAWLSWTMFAGQLPYEAAKEGSFLRFLRRKTKMVRQSIHYYLLTFVLKSLCFHI